MSFSLICWIGIFFPLHDNILLLFLFCAYLTTLSWFMIPFVIEMAMIIQIEMAMMTIIQKYCLLLFFNWGSIHLSGGGRGFNLESYTMSSEEMQKYQQQNAKKEWQKCKSIKYVCELLVLPFWAQSLIEKSPNWQKIPFHYFQILKSGQDKSI